ncbi:helix-turn-helix domain-containing protein [Anaerotignum sp. MB30-C6]|uniref:helix-turn-helix domain-containing protein n=1 Tax=Anaerotignum sp. MB30-C6 TaxID=3070814 RepID=UPI0027DC6E76|nr:helix-turn-helix transcriptional regulator [Anaerotignum sp. MB30-C6]WMI82066.1 helix-turn-helix transcriptional regulator [Anaerotignum sp. MB30-C6]
MSLNDRIKEARLNKGLTQEQLGKLIGVAKTTVAGYEKNREPDASTIGAIIDALNVDANFLFQDEMRELQFNSFSIPEIGIIKKYRSLNDSGKEMVNMVLEKEYERSKVEPSTQAETTKTTVEDASLEYDHLMPIAAHLDNPSEEQMALVQKDLERLMKLKNQM